MSTEDKFEVTWEADDGYVGGRRPHSFYIRAADVEGMTESELTEFFWDEIKQDFQNRVSPWSRDEAKFLAWAGQVKAEAD